MKIIVLCFHRVMPLQISQYQSNITLKKNGVKRIVQRFDLDKAHDGYMINIRMVKIFRDAIIETIFIVSEICSKFRTFSEDWKQ